MPAAAALPFIISAGGSIAQGAIGASAAGRAAKQQMAAMGEAVGVNDRAVNQSNDLIANAANAASDQVRDSAQLYGQALIDKAGGAGQDLRVSAAEANDLLRPYLQLGESGAASLLALLNGGDFVNTDPGAKYRMDQAMKAVEASAAARGGALGGGALLKLQRNASDLASQEYGNSFARLAGISNMGMGAANTAGQNMQGAVRQQGDWNIQAQQGASGMNFDAAKYGGNVTFQSALNRAQNWVDAAKTNVGLITGRGEAQSAGTMGAANAWGGAVGGTANALGSWAKSSAAGKGKGQ